jgi:hypothetical protein
MVALLKLSAFSSQDEWVGARSSGAEGTQVAIWPLREQLSTGNPTLPERKAVVFSLADRGRATVARHTRVQANVTGGSVFRDWARHGG